MTDELDKSLFFLGLLIVNLCLVTNAYTCPLNQNYKLPDNVTFKKFYYKVDHHNILTCGFIENRAPVTDGKKVGFIDEQGNVVIPLVYNQAENFSEGTSWVSITQNNKEKIGMINVDGKVIVPFIIDKLLPEPNGVVGDYALALNTEKLLGGYYRNDGKTIVPIKYNNLTSVSENLIGVKKGDYWGIYNTDGNIVLKPSLKYDDMSEFFGGIAKVNNKEKYGFINTEGKQVIKVQYDFAEQLSDGLILVGIKKESQNKAFEEAPIATEYKVEQTYKEIPTRDPYLYGIYNVRGNLIVPVTYEKNIKITKDGRIKAYIDGREYTYDFNGSLLTKK